MTRSISTSRRSTVVVAAFIVASLASGDASAFTFPDLVFPEYVPVPSARPDADVTGSIPRAGRGVSEPGHSAASKNHKTKDGRIGSMNRGGSSVEREAKR